MIISFMVEGSGSKLKLNQELATQARDGWKEVQRPQFPRNSGPFFRSALGVRPRVLQGFQV